MEAEVKGNFDLDAKLLERSYSPVGASEKNRIGLCRFNFCIGAIFQYCYQIVVGGKTWSVTKTDTDIET